MGSMTFSEDQKLTEKMTLKQCIAACQVRNEIPKYSKYPNNLVAFQEIEEATGLSRRASDCHDCPGDCTCRGGYSPRHSDEFDYWDQDEITCALDSPKPSTTARIKSCSASFEQYSWPCKEAMDGKKNDKHNGWAYGSKYHPHIVFDLSALTYISKIVLQTGHAYGGHRIKKFKLKIKTDHWRTPRNIKVEIANGMTDPATVDDEGVITIKENGRINIYITFDPIDAMRVLLKEIESDGSNGILNEITIYRAGKLFS